MPETPAPSAETLRLMREVVAPELAEVYPQFAAKVFGIGKAGLKAPIADRPRRGMVCYACPPVRMQASQAKDEMP